MKHLKLKILDDKIGKDIPLPSFATPGSAGLDLAACIDAPITLAPDESALIPTGIAIHIADPNYVGMLYPRSGLGHKHGIVLGNGTGVIDADYQGPLMLSMLNRSKTPYTIRSGERIAQLVITAICQPVLQVITDFPDLTQRGEGGFGSSDHE